MSRILTIDVPIVVRLGSCAMKVSDVTNLAPGSIIELPKRADAELDLLCNNKVIGCGTAVKVGENFGLRITYIGDIKHRIGAMGAAA
ncbi:MAG: FliM/FliN family flagellar motor switch protein [Planctomycetes bacterium]|nr:FliM/FliN family flagellar motor switch protein [Planctomycetota bacterium]